MITTTPPAVAPPLRFRAAERRSARIGLPVRLAGRVTRTDEALMSRIGRAFHEQDELGDRVVAQSRMPHLRAALTDGIDALEDPPAALRELFAEAGTDPAWLDRDLLGRGQRVYHRFGQNAADVLLQLSLIGGYRFGGPTDLLVATGGLTGGRTRRRLAETQAWTTALSQPGGLNVGGEAWRLTLHVRAMHALVNRGMRSRWDVDQWGLPINVADQAATLGLFDGVVLLGVRALGVPVSRDDSRAVMHMWKYVGWLLGIPEEFLVDTETERHRLNYHLLLAQGDVTAAGRELSQAIVTTHRHLHFDSDPAGLRGRFEQERLLSMLTMFLGPRSMRDLGLPLRPPWAHAYVTALNLVRYRTGWGRRRLDSWGEAVRTRVMERYFGADAPHLARLGSSRAPDPTPS